MKVFLDIHCPHVPRDGCPSCLRLQILQHEDDRNFLILDLQRGGLSEYILAPAELAWLGAEIVRFCDSHPKAKRLA